MGEHFLYFIVSLVATAILGVVGVLIWRIVFLHFQKKHRVEQSKQIRFLQVQIPKNAVARSSDIDAKDHIQSM